MVRKVLFGFFCVAMFVFCNALTSYAQRISDSLNFRNPVDIPLNLSGNFGEFRSNHFHTGIDIKTNGKTGFPVYAIADGWVRRVKTGPFSYGKVLYVDHYSGHTSVYAHLSNYNDSISSFLALAQKALKRNEVDVFPNVNRIPIKRGELLGYTGNTGRSGGPHLHFEVRTSDTEKPLNPLLLGFKVKDDVPPSINGLLVEHFTDSIRGKVASSKRYYAKGSATKKTISESVKLSDLSGLAIHSLDYLSNSRNSCGIYSIDLFLDDSLCYSMKLDSLDFSAGRDINAHKVYSIFKSEKSSFHRCFIQPNNRLPIYNRSLSGLIELSDNDTHNVKILVKDAALNQSTLTFKVKKGTSQKKGKLGVHEFSRFDEVNSVIHDGCSIRIPPYRLVNDEVISIEEFSISSGKKISRYYKVGDESIPLQNKITLSIKVDNLSGIDSTKLFITRYNPKNGRYYTQAGEYKDGWMKTRVKQFGVYTVDSDVNAPSVTWKNREKELTSSKKIRITISDDNSGIFDYSLQVNGEWVPLYYNYKSSRLEGKLEEEFSLESVLEYRLEVRDERKNSKVIEGLY